MRYTIASTSFERSRFLPRSGTRRRFAGASALLAVLLAATPAWAQEEGPVLGWKNSTELGWVFTSGNSNTNNFNVRNVFEYNWQTANFAWEFDILRADSADDRFAIGTEDNFEVIEPPLEPDNSRLQNKIRYLRNINDRFFWYGRFDTVRDQPADIDYRLTPAVGAGNTWADRDSLTLRTGYGVSYTAEKLKLEGERNFAGYQLFYELLAKATESTTIESNMTFDGSFDQGDDFRFNWYNGAGVAINERIALKASIRLVYRNVPALEELDLETPLGIEVGKVVVPKAKLDTSLTTALVINF